MATRKSNTLNAQTVEIKNIPVVEAASAPQEDEFDWKAFMRLSGVQLPSWKRSLVGFIASLATGYLIGSVASALINLLVVSLGLAAGSFLATCIYIVGFIIALYLAFKAGQKIGMYVVTGDIDADIASVKNRIIGWFSSKPVIAAA